MVDVEARISCRAEGTLVPGGTKLRNRVLRARGDVSASDPDEVEDSDMSSSAASLDESPIKSALSSWIGCGESTPLALMEA